ncbi:hypothetical protein SAMD00019534_086200 [Acytostelium subglobosum LB1]|uniref:hypothetical protein n=1 Tax=Acytostelium subglobosum LB1 TaxID=1410327 RepID=UPI00064480D4|nr:hypothetical protein SAMD00019534_086200 [Acytostelium subglobosum LB1]GAM25445.1 hypothetical protein SAMD00019534_086200 [Acytostelium subglobosum LB1]|eukprot:XP_012751431.1 hypothetical protein SAMD00019534_086200 [Acytostelium subglobosum LB1]
MIDTLSLLLIKEIASHLSDSLVDSLMLSLVCKRLFKERSKYILLDDTQLPMYNSLGNIQSSTNLQSYKHIITNQLVKNKYLNILICIEPVLNLPNIYDYVFVTKAQQTDRFMIKDILDIPIIGSVTFSDLNDAVGFKQSFWISAIPLFEGLIARGVTDISYFCYGDIIALPPIIQLTKITFNIFYENRYNDGNIPPLPLHALPATLTNLKISSEREVYPFNKVLPHTLKYLDLTNARYSQSLLTGGLPIHLESLKLSKHHNIPAFLPGSLPPNLKTLMFYRSYEYVINKAILPPSITFLYFSDGYMRPLGKLPDSLTDLQVHGQGTGIISHPSLDTLVLYSHHTLNQGMTFEHLNDLVLTHLPERYVSTITSTMFPRLKYLTIVVFKPRRTTKVIDLSGLPSTIISLSLVSIDGPQFGTIPHGVRMVLFKCGQHFDYSSLCHLPPTVASLELLRGDHTKFAAIASRLPKSIRNLDIRMGGIPIQWLQCLPPTIKEVSIDLNIKDSQLSNRTISDVHLRRMTQSLFFISWPDKSMGSGFITIKP